MCFQTSVISVYLLCACQKRNKTTLYIGLQRFPTEIKFGFTWKRYTIISLQSMRFSYKVSGAFFKPNHDQRSPQTSHAHFVCKSMATPSIVSWISPPQWCDLSYRDVELLYFSSYYFLNIISPYGWCNTIASCIVSPHLFMPKILTCCRLMTSSSSTII